MASLLGGLGGGVVGRAVVEVVGDTAKLRSDLGKAKAETKSATGQMGAATSKFGAMAKVAMVVAGAALVKFAVSSVKAASDLGESMNKARVVFESASDSVIAFAESASAIGLAKSQALEAAGAFGAMLQSAGLAEKQSADMSITMTKLAADLASFNNQDPSEMLERLRSGLAGEAEPLRRFGIYISEGRVQTEALALGLGTASGVLTDQEKILARYNIILQDSTKAQGDFARTAGESLPNQMRILKAEITNLQAEFGEALLPAVLATVEIFRELLEAVGPILVMLGKLASAVVENEAAFTILLLAIHPLLGLLKMISMIENPVEGFVKGITGETDIQLAKFNAAVEAGADNIQAMVFAFGDAAAAGALAGRHAGGAARGIDQVGAAAGGAAPATADLAAVTFDAAEAIRSLHLATLEAAGGFVGVQAALLSAAEATRGLQEAQATVNQLQADGKQGTDEYRDAVFALRDAEVGAIESQIGLTNALADYYQGLIENEVSEQEAIRRVRQLGHDAGLSRGQIRDLIDSVRTYGRTVDENTPKRLVLTANTADALAKANAFLGVWNSIQDKAVRLTMLEHTAVPGGALGGVVGGQAGGVVVSPTMIRPNVVAGEGRYSTPAGPGAEHIIPYNERGIGYLADALGRAMAKAGGSGPAVVVLKIGEREFARAVVKGFTDEGHRR